MRLAVDIREALRPKRTGKGTWTLGFLKEMLRRDTALDLFTDVPLPDHLKTEHVRERRIQTKGIRWHANAAFDVRMDRSIDVYVSPTSYIVPALLGQSKRSIPIVHDLIAFQDEPHEKRTKRIERWTLPRVAKTAWKICTVSLATRNDFMARFPVRDPTSIHSIFAGPLCASIQKNISDQKTILCAATLCPRKNQARLIEAYTALPDDLRTQYRLVLVGARGWDDDRIIALAKRTPGVTWRAYVPDSEYERLLETAAIFALPSLYEGFGMQILDALQRGIPVLTSARGSLKEVTGDAAVTVDPKDVRSITAGLSSLLRDEQLQEELRERGPRQANLWSWKNTVDRFLAMLEK